MWQDRDPEPIVLVDVLPGVKAQRSTGRPVDEVSDVPAVGWLDRDHTSLDGDPSGHWLLYLSGPDLFLSLDGAAPFKLTTGLGAAAWS